MINSGIFFIIHLQCKWSANKKITEKVKYSESQIPVPKSKSFYYPGISEGWNIDLMQRLFKVNPKEQCAYVLHIRI